MANLVEQQVLRTGAENTAGKQIALGVVSFAVVDAAGNGDYTTIDAAVTAGEKNIFVRAGAYTAAANIALSDDTLLISQGGNDTTTLDMGAYTFDVGNDCRVQGIEIKSNQDSAAYIMVRVNQKVNVVFDSVHFHSTKATDHSNQIYLLDVVSASYNVTLQSCSVTWDYSGAASILMPQVDLTGAFGGGVYGLRLIGGHAGSRTGLRIGGNYVAAGIYSTVGRTDGSFFVVTGDGCVLGPDGVSVNLNGSNSSISGGSVQNVVLNSSGCTISSCNVAGDLSVGNGNSIVAGCKTNTLTIGPAGDNSLITGTVVTSTISWSSGADNVKMTGCDCASGSFTILAPNPILTGNRFANLVTIDGNNAIITGNRGSFTLNVGTSGGVITGNKGTVTDNGSNNDVNNFT